MSELADRAEEIAAHLVSCALGAEARKFDAAGRQSAVDFMLEWPDGRQGALEVTLVTHPESSAWQGSAAREGWRWPARSGWEFRLIGDGMPYRQTRKAVLEAIEVCDREMVDAPDRLPPRIRFSHPNIEWLRGIGELRRTSLTPGVVLLPAVRAEFVEAANSDFATLIEEWLRLPHMPRHLEKVKSAASVDERHLFLVPVDDVLPARFFTNDFAPPRRELKGFGGIDGVWIWSNYWHQYLVGTGERWHWVDFPPPKSSA